MTRRKMRALGVAVAGSGMIGATLLAATAGATSPRGLTPVPNANPKTPGFTQPDVLSPELARTIVAQGSMKLENGTAAVPYYGYNGPGTFVPLPGTTAEANKTEPDKNTYLVLEGQKGADPNYNYGTHFLFQGHETGAPGYITRVNLDADVAHRVTLLASTDVKGTPLPTFDGSTWNPFAQRLLFTAELGNKGGVWQATLDVPSKVEDISGALGRGGYEGIQNDSAGNLYIVEDVGGPTDSATKSKIPNSFLYRFVPVDASDLTKGGKLQALSLTSLRTGKAFDFKTFSDDVKDLHTYGKTFEAKWVTIHDTAVDGNTPFDANAAAVKAGGTPFKRPENGVFRPGSNFKEFFFTETGDTNADSTANAEYGGYGALIKVTQANVGADTAKVSMFYKGDKAHTGLDNITFFDATHVAAGEDAGDTLHAQRNGLDSAFMFDTRLDYSDPKNAPVRFLAQGRDASATIDSALAGLSPVPADFKNDGDNEITGIHVSDGDPTTEGILGAKVPRKVFSAKSDWRVFYTSQHGDNITWEIIAAPHGSEMNGEFDR